MFQKLMIISLLGLLLFSSCSKNKETQGCGLFNTMELSARLTEVGDASSALSEEETAANCTRYKNAWSAYLDTAEKFLDCSFVDRADLDKNIAEAKAAIAQEDCNL